MKENERIKQLRKSLQLTQEQFGNRLGVTKVAISNLEKGNRGLTEQMIKSISREFNVSELWLRHGSGVMNTEPAMFNLDDYVRSHGMTEFELEIVKAYFGLEPELRKTIIQHFKAQLSHLPPINYPEHETSATKEDMVAESNHYMDYYSEAPKTPEELERLFPPIKTDIA